MNFACVQCSEPCSLDDAKVPASGLRVTCQRCGLVFAVKPGPPPLTLPGGTASDVATACSTTTEPSGTLPPENQASPPGSPGPRQGPGDDHARFFTSPPGSHRLVSTQEWVISTGVLNRNYRPAIAIGAVVIVLVAGGLWKAGPSRRGEAVTGTPLERRGGAPEGTLDERPRPAPPRRPPPGPAEAAPPLPRGGPGVAAGATTPTGPSLSSRDAEHPASPAMPTSDRQLLDLLARKQDAAGVAAPAAGELSTGRASLDESTIRSVLANNSSAFSACVARAAKADPSLHREKKMVVLELVVMPSGRVSAATLEDPTYAQTALGGCFVAAARRMVFPSFAGEEIVVHAPIRLSSAL